MIRLDVQWGHKVAVHLHHNHSTPVEQQIGTIWDDKVPVKTSGQGDGKNGAASGKSNKKKIDSGARDMRGNTKIDRDHKGTNNKKGSTGNEEVNLSKTSSRGRTLDTSA